MQNLLAFDVIRQAPLQLGESAQHIRQDLSAAADQASSAIATLFSSTTARAAASLDQTVAQAEGVTSRLAQDLWWAISADIKHWLDQHILLAWLLSHPLIALGLTFVAVVLLWGLVQAGVQLAQRGWALVLRLPLYLLRLSWIGAARLLHWVVASAQAAYQRRYGRHYRSSSGDAGLSNTAVPLPAAPLPAAPPLPAAAPQVGPPTEHQAQVVEVLKHLEALGQAQTQALQHLIALMEQTPAPPMAESTGNRVGDKSPRV